MEPPKRPEREPLRQHPKHKRKGLGELFDISTTIPPAAEQDPPPSPIKRLKMSGELRNTIRAKWPLLSQSETKPISLTIRADNVYRVYATDDQDPQKLFEKATRYLDTLRGLTRSVEQDKVVEDQIHEMMIHAIFGSNSIERAGLGLDVTLHLCRKILQGEPLPDIDDRDPEYQQKLMELYKVDSSLKGMPLQYIMRGRREIVQHVKAFQHLVHHFVIQNEDMTEDLIKETHKILCDGTSIIQEDMPEVPSDKYAGQYRTVAVGAGGSMFVVPSSVPQKMREMCDDLKNELEEAESKGAIDPFSIGSKYSLQFVQIHPFQDGNGRLCRMILNVIVFRYTGIFVSIGEREEDRSDYMAIKKRASAEMEGHGEYATFILKKGMRSIQKMKQKLHGKKA